MLTAYHFLRKALVVVALVISPVQFVLDAPFGRFSPKGRSVLLVDGRVSWMVMEIFAPLALLLSFQHVPVAEAPASATLPPLLLAGLFLLHYANRAIVSPLRTPSRSKSHIVVPLCAIGFNVINGFLIGAHLSSASTRVFLQQHCATPTFFVGIVLWALGFAGNIAHDEILLDIRRTARRMRRHGEGEHYAIPYGMLYRYISYPNYMCEWVEWLGFALAAAPLPFARVAIRALRFSTLVQVLHEPAYVFAPDLSPPWIFLLCEVLFMLPRAVRGHRWYHSRFGDAYPKERRAVVPFIL